MFLIVGKEGQLLYQLKNISEGKVLLPNNHQTTKKDEIELELYGALDTIAAFYESNTDPNRKDWVAALPFDSIDKHTLSFSFTPGGTYVCTVGTKFVVLHAAKQSEKVAGFFEAVYRLYVIQIMSALYVPGAPITSSEFHRRVKESIKDIHLGNNLYCGLYLSLIHICRCRRYAVCRSRWSPYH
eukprot:TRINITY_DN10872_c0_g4_i1.p1 TRINITY_DN10872_c0_g4~~TRINITY_DN10872_c0_g4_i1.p1  ORF type:complete len:184 (+),score=30.00 TRINITY_DN10872_c0_g4_i1:158-709(+)